MLGSPVRPWGKTLQSGRLRVKDPWSDQQEQGWRLKGKGQIFLRSGSDSTHLPFSSQRTAAKPDMMTMISSAHVCVVYTCEHTCFHVCRHMCACMHVCLCGDQRWMPIAVYFMFWGRTSHLNPELAYSVSPVSQLVLVVHVFTHSVWVLGSELGSSCLCGECFTH